MGISDFLLPELITRRMKLLHAPVLLQSLWKNTMQSVASGSSYKSGNSRVTSTLQQIRSTINSKVSLTGTSGFFGWIISINQPEMFAHLVCSVNGNVCQWTRFQFTQMEEHHWITAEQVWMWWMYITLYIYVICVFRIHIYCNMCNIPLDHHYD